MLSGSSDRPLPARLTAGAEGDGDDDRVILYHATDDAGAAGIAAEGFRGSLIRDSCGHQWLSSDRTWTDTATVTATTMVIVELADDLAETYRDWPAPDFPHPCYFRVPVDVLNAHGPFGFEPIRESDRWSP